MPYSEFKMLSKIKRAYNRIFGYPSFQITITNYDAYWEKKRGEHMGTLNAFQHKRVEFVASRIKEGTRILDFGAGDGAVLMALRRKKKFHPIAVDISAKAISFLKSNGIDAMLTDPTSTDYIDHLPQADYILLLEVLEHMQNPEKFLLAMRDKCKRSIFFSFPNTGYFTYRLRMLFGRFPIQWRTHPGEHLRYWTLADLKWWLVELNIAQQCQINCYLGPNILRALWPSLFAAAFIVEFKMVQEDTSGRRQDENG